MSKTKEEENLKEKLNYLGLNLERIPKFLKEEKPLSYRPSKTYDSNNYKVYRYVDVNEIQILLTPTDRLADLNEKYKKSVSISRYLDSKSEENIEYFTTFLSMLNHTQIEEIEALEKEQENLKEKIPYQVKYENNFLWQIYYSDISKQYFMLVPTNEYSSSSLFYLLKKQIEAQKARRKELIYVPISGEEYQASYLLKSQIADLENYLWYFTKEWPNIYEVYDNKEKLRIKIVGQTSVYEKIESIYVITLENKEEALEQYKLIKALFILATGLPEDYQFKTNITLEGELEFKMNEEAITYQHLMEFIQTQVSQKKVLFSLEEKRIGKEQEKLRKLKETAEKQTEEYLARQRQIATFLECKKTFFGKVKYYFSNRKKEFQNANRNRIKPKEVVEESTSQEAITVMQTEKEIYTIEDLIEICTKLEARRKMVKNIILDEKALELKVINLERKIKNANIYLNEIELHKKSIFEFWKFTNKDELPSLNEGEEETRQKKEKIGKSFDYEIDIEDLGKRVDELQRRKLSKNETDSIFAVKQVLESSQILEKTKSIDLVKEQNEILEKELQKLKQNYQKDIEIIHTKDFDIFGGIVEDKTKIKMLNNQKHREIEKDPYHILNITLQTDLNSYIDGLRNHLNFVKEAFCKIACFEQMPIYLMAKEQVVLENLQIFHINPKEVMKLANHQEEVYLYKINWQEGIPMVYYSNIIFYDNLHQTLPLGMDLSDEVLVNLDNVKLIEKAKSNFSMNRKQDEFTYQVIKVKVIEYEVKNKGRIKEEKKQ